MTAESLEASTCALALRAVEVLLWAEAAGQLHRAGAAELALRTITATMSKAERDRLAAALTRTLRPAPGAACARCKGTGDTRTFGAVPHAMCAACWKAVRASVTADVLPPAEPWLHVADLRRAYVRVQVEPRGSLGVRSVGIECAVGLSVLRVRERDLCGEGGDLLSVLVLVDEGDHFSIELPRLPDDEPRHLTVPRASVIFGSAQGMSLAEPDGPVGAAP